MTQLSRHAFIRLVVVSASAAFLGGVGCSDGAMRASGLRRPYPYDHEEEDRDPTESSPGEKTTKGAAIEGEADGGGDAAEAGAADLDAGSHAVASPPPQPNACLQDLTLDEVAGVTSAHAHAFTIPAADFTANADRTYTMAGGHAHTVTITAAQFAMLRAGMTVNVTSGEGNGHTHACAIRCA